MTSVTVTIVNACTRDGSGGSPTAVLRETPMTDERRRRVPVLAGTSHAVFVAAEGDRVSLRFFTAAGELPACGHGTVAALAWLADNEGCAGFQGTLAAAGREFGGLATWNGDHAEASFDAGRIGLREPAAGEREAVTAALGAADGVLTEGIGVASIGRERLLVPVADRHALAALAPDFGLLRVACDRFGLLGCYVHTPPDGTGRLAARMFAPSIGVPEDIANANSTACLAAHLAGSGVAAIGVDMGDSLGSPATITAAVTPRGVRLGGAARIARTLDPP
ncbi:PhzF family phenazine biosynthesis isomerase [Phytomonospora sp. NPDC050363]|uniref:PhzF family phenazine biosynthesis protein n=1 Tax=Phytomonospora sp. NPDC050363 TaxID=3155642 RepID=UPI0033D84F0C